MSVVKTNEPFGTKCPASDFNMDKSYFWVANRTKRLFFGFELLFSLFGDVYLIGVLYFYKHD